MIYINIKKHLNINKKNIYMVIDFDKTITSYESVDSWGASANPNVVQKELSEEMDLLYKKYRPIEMDYKISEKEKIKAMQKWYSECMDLYYKYNLTKSQITKSIEMSKIEFRNGVEELLLLLYEKDIPVIILSAGIGNTIKQFLKFNSCLFENMYIISNFIEFDRNGKVKKFDNSKIIHTLNKTMEGHLIPEVEEKIQNRNYKILIGDLVEDIKMVDEKELDTTLRIGILNKEMQNKENLKLYNNKFDIVLTEDENLGEFIKKLIKI